MLLCLFEVMFYRKDSYIYSSLNTLSHYVVQTDRLTSASLIKKKSVYAAHCKRLPDMLAQLSKVNLNQHTLIPRAKVQGHGGPSA